MTDEMNYPGRSVVSWGERARGRGLAHAGRKWHPSRPPNLVDQRKQGADSLPLPRAVGQVVTHLANSNEAGTEANTEDFRDIVPPCQDLIGVTGGPGTGQSHSALAQNSVIHHHPGISGRHHLLPEVHGWPDPVMKIEVEALP
jgi:hypothetical protein